MPEPIRKSILPTTPPPEWEFATVLGAPHGCALLPTDTGDVVVRRRVTYGDWEPVRPDHWADEPATVGGAARTASGQQPETAPCACTHPQNRHLSACTECPCVGYAPTWPRQTTGSEGPDPCSACPTFPCRKCVPAVGQPAEAQAVCGDPTGCHRVVPCARPCGTDFLAEVDEQVRESKARDRAAVLREAADTIDATYTGFGIDRYVRHGADLLRRMAEEARS